MARVGVKQADLALTLNRSQAQISARLNGDVPWRVDELQLVAERLEVPLSTLLAGVGTQRGAGAA